MCVVTVRVEGEVGEAAEGDENEGEEGQHHQLGLLPPQSTHVTSVTPPNVTSVSASNVTSTTSHCLFTSVVSHGHIQSLCVVHIIS